jgi:hypothetical protein
MIPKTVSRVRDHTVDESNARIRRQIEENIALFGNAGHETLERRLAELDYEWDIERTLKANAGSVILLGCLLGATVDRKWFLLSTAAAGFSLQYEIQGGYPPVGLFQRLGFRTATEIDYERYALKALRGDFRNAPSADHKDRAEISRLLQTVER